ncbi:hypothetical protein BD626DRAFT_506592 [Schizophyllum amplum]|uniref:Uncharacterized protein n=1 Tax=Schizophyllum amplum TaxID=97359 RepID=A0A550C4V8_9AGAR|nr:hypothetical protein BD626DRAFT_506592 [Auriculariopsis ampla]
MLDGKMLKKTRPRRTVDFNGGMGRWNLQFRDHPASARHRHLHLRVLPLRTLPGLCRQDGRHQVAKPFEG